MDEYFGYFNLEDPDSLKKALKDLENFITLEGPFDIVMCVSIMSSLIGHLLQKIDNLTQPPFRGGIFFSEWPL